MVFHVRGSNANRKRSTSATAIILSSCILPVYAKWFTNHRRENPDVQITYESIGSESGVRELLANSVDFGASDSPDVVPILAPGDEEKYLSFPSVAGAVVPVVNLPGWSSDIAFTVGLCEAAPTRCSARTTRTLSKTTSKLGSAPNLVPRVKQSTTQVTKLVSYVPYGCPSPILRTSFAYRIAHKTNRERLHGAVPITRKSMPLPPRIFTFPLLERSVIRPTGSVRPACVRLRFGKS
jgi:PBP superfamily domain